MRTLRHALVFFFFVLSYSLSAQQSTIKSSYYFEINSHEIIEKEKLMLDSLITNINWKTVTQISIIGFADSTGNKTFNEQLSKNRALSIETYLRKRLIANDSIKWFVSIEYPQKSENLALDRRVDVFVNQTEKIDTNEQELIPNTSKIDSILTLEKTDLIQKSYLELNYQEIISQNNISYWVPKDTAGNYEKIGIQESIDQRSMQSQNMHTMARNYNMESIYMSKVCFGRIKIGDTIFIEISKKMIENNPGVKFFVQGSNLELWEASASNVEKYFDSTRNSYLFPLRRTTSEPCMNINLDIPIYGPPLIVYFDAKAPTGKKKLLVFKEYKYAYPKFSYYPDSLNTSAFPEVPKKNNELHKNSIKFRSFNKFCSGTLVSKISLDYVDYQSVEHIDFADVKKRFGKYYYHAKLKFSKDFIPFVPKARSSEFAAN